MYAISGALPRPPPPTPKPNKCRVRLMEESARRRGSPAMPAPPTPQKKKGRNLPTSRGHVVRGGMRGDGQCGKLSQAPPYASTFHGFRTLRRRIISRCYREVRSLSLSSSSSSSSSFSISRHFALAPISGPLPSIATAPFPPVALPPYPLSLVLTTFLVAHVWQKTAKVKLVKRNCQSSILPDFESARPLKKNPP